MFFGLFGNRAKTIQATVEYHAPYWHVMIRNAGQKNWVSLRDPNSLIAEQDERGDVVRTRPAIQKFDSMANANHWIEQNMQGVQLVQRSETEIRDFAHGIDRKRPHVLEMSPAG